MQLCVSDALGECASPPISKRNLDSGVLVRIGSPYIKPFMVGMDLQSIVTSRCASALAATRSFSFGSRLNGPSPKRMV